MTSSTTSKTPIEDRRYSKTEMGNDGYNDQVLSKIKQWLIEAKLFHQACIDQITSLEHELISLLAGLTPADTDETLLSESEKIMVKNGQRLESEECIESVIDDCDVILDLTVDTLQFRRDPVGHSELLLTEIEDLTNVGPYRIKLLTYMLEHPGRYVSIENAATCHGDPNAERVPSTLRENISFLRQALGTPGSDNPYIKTKRSTSPCSYALDSKWSYLVIKWKKYC